MGWGGSVVDGAGPGEQILIVAVNLLLFLSLQLNAGQLILNLLLGEGSSSKQTGSVSLISSLDFLGVLVHSLLLLLDPVLERGHLFLENLGGCLFNLVCHTLLVFVDLVSLVGSLDAALEFEDFLVETDELTETFFEGIGEDIPVIARGLFLFGSSLFSLGFLFDIFGLLSCHIKSNQIIPTQTSIQLQSSLPPSFLLCSPSFCVSILSVITLIIQTMSEQEDHSLSGPMTVIAMVNGMIGGLILILPVMALESGWLLTLIVLIITGFISYYSCYLCVLHTGDDPDLDIAIERHFWNSRKIRMVYQFCIFLTLITLSILYYQLIVIQWEGLACNNEYTPFNPIINAFALIAMVLVIKFKEFGATLMAYGIISIVTYLFFLTWAVGSEDTNHDQKELILFHGDGIDLAAALGQAFAIQAFFIPILKQNKKAHKYKLYTMMAFVLGILAYGYIAFMGSQGIVHRTFMGDESQSKTIEGYFQPGAWQVKVIEVIYLVHLYSVFPEFLLISKKRIFSVFRLEQSQSLRINKKEIIYILAVISFCLAMALIKISLRELVEFNGAVIGFFFIYLFPSAIHFKCVFMKHNHQEESKENQKEKENEKYVEMIEEPNKEEKQVEAEGEGEEKIDPVSDDKESYKTSQPEQIDNSKQSQIKRNVCWGRKKERSIHRKRCELVIIVFMIVLGLTILVQGVIEMFSGDLED